MKMNNRKICGYCNEYRDMKYIEIREQHIENYRPYSGRRLLVPRTAVHKAEIWKCTICGGQGSYNEETVYGPAKRGAKKS